MVWIIKYTESSSKQLKKLDKQTALRVLDYMDERVAVLAGGERGARGGHGEQREQRDLDVRAQRVATARGDGRQAVQCRRARAAQRRRQQCQPEHREQVQRQLVLQQRQVPRLLSIPKHRQKWQQLKLKI